MTLTIIDARAQWGVDTPAELAAAYRARGRGVELRDPDEREPADAKVIAYVNHGRWVGDCLDCNGAEYVAPGLPFMCAECWNAAIDGRFREVVFPNERRAIEAVLARRPHQANANWFPHETVADLRAENDEHGVER